MRIGKSFRIVGRSRAELEVEGRRKREGERRNSGDRDVCEVVFLQFNH